MKTLTQTQINVWLVGHLPGASCNLGGNPVIKHIHRGKKGVLGFAHRSVQGQRFTRSQLLQSPLCPLTTQSDRAELPRAKLFPQWNCYQRTPSASCCSWRQLSQPSPGPGQPLGQALLSSVNICSSSLPCEQVQAPLRPRQVTQLT